VETIQKRLMRKLQKLQSSAARNSAIRKMNVARSRNAARKVAARKNAIRRTSAARSRVAVRNRNAQNAKNVLTVLIVRLQKAKSNMLKDIAPAISFFDIWLWIHKTIMFCGSDI
jgi:hypothetical protein